MAGQDSGCNITEFLKTRKFLRMWERLRYGICAVVMEKMLEQRQGSLDTTGSNTFAETQGAEQEVHAVV